MAVEADRVVVELIAKNDQFDANVRASSTAYSKGMKDIETAGAGAEKAHGRLTASVGNSRIAMLEFQHIARGTADQIAAGAPLTQVLAQHMGMLAQAVSLAGGAFGKVGAFLGGPWGLALTVAAAGVATLIMRHHDEADTLEDVIKKRQKHRDETELSAKADEMWSHTLDGLIERLKKTNDELGARLRLQPVINQQAFTAAAATVAELSRELDKAEATMDANDPRLRKLHNAFSEAVRQLYQDTIVLGEQQGAAMSDLSKAADDWAARQTNIIRFLIGAHPELMNFSGQINQAFDLFKKAASDAAAAGIDFNPIAKQVDALNNKLAESPQFIKDYIVQLRQLAQQLENTANAAKNAPKAIEDFKRSVFGAEGTGPNRLGSSAAGFGQFMPSTWLSYFNRLFPDKASLTDAAKLAFRDNKEVASAVIDKATDDYVTVLKQAGQQITAAALYTVHLLGAGDARRFFAAPSGASTSSVLSQGVLAGNPFLRGTVGSASAAIAKRIGDSSGAVSSGSVAIARQLQQEQDALEKQLDEMLKKDVDITLEKAKQADLSKLLGGNTLEAAAAEAQLKQHAEDVAKQLEDAKNIGRELVDDILNPDNWDDWGEAGKRILHDLEAEMFRLAIINPLKNMLFGDALPTFGSLFSALGGGFDAGLFSQIEASNFAALVPHFAGGGAFRVRGGDTNVLSINGQARAMVGGDETVAVLPNNARAASAGDGGPSVIVVKVEPNDDRFDAYVESIAGPLAAQAGTRGAYGGAGLARANLARRQMHQLGSRG
jgi:hypothetical protein